MERRNTFFRILLPAMLFTLIIAWACKDEVTSPDIVTYEISGQLLDEDDLPIADAILQVFSGGSGIQGLISKDTTDENGYFTLKNLPENDDNLELRIEHDDFMPMALKLKDVLTGKDKKNIKVKMQHDTDCTGKLSIKVKDINDNPINDAEVRLNIKEKVIRKSYTNDKGEVLFKYLCPNDYWVRIYKSGYKVIEEEFSVKKGDSLNFNFKLLGNDDDTCCHGIIYFSVKDSSNNEPVSNVTVRLWKGKDKIEEGKTNDDGKIAFDGVCEGNYQISFFKEGYIGQEFNFEMGCNDTVEFNKYIVEKDDSCCNGVIYLIVQDSTSNQAIENAKVNLWMNGKLLEDGKTNSAGIVKFTELCEGKYGFSVQKEGYKSFEFDVELGCDDTLEIHKKMLKMQKDSCCDGKIVLHVKDSTNNESINLAKVNLWRSGKLISTKKTENGKVIFEELCEGKYGIDIEHEKYKGIEFEIELGCNKVLELTKKLISREQKDSCCDGKIVLHVKDSTNNESINLAKVNLWRSGKLISTKKTENGSVIFEELCEGKYGIDIEHEKYKGIEFEIELGCNKVLELTKKLIPREQKDSCCNGVIKVAPYDKETKEIIKGAKVKLWFGKDLIYQETVHEEPLVIKNLCEGEYQFTFIAEGYKSAEEDIKLGCNDTIDFPFYMEPLEKDSCCDGKFKISVRDSSNNEIIKGALVRLWKNGKKIAEMKTKDEYIIFENLCEGKYAVDILHEDYKNIEFEFELPCNETVEMIKYLVKDGEPCCDGKLKIRPINKNTKKVIKGATVKLWKNGDLLDKKVVEGDYVIFEKLCKGGYGVDIIHDNYKNIEFEIELGCDEFKEITKELEPLEDDTCCNNIIYTVVKDSSDNSKLKGVLAKLWKDGKPYKYGYTNENGLYVFENVCEGQYALTFNKDGYKERETHLQVKCKDTLELHFRMLKESKDTCETAEALIKVKDKETKEPISGAIVKIYDKNNNLIAEGETNDNGEFLKTGLKAPSYYKFLAKKDGYNAEDASEEWDKCIRKTIILELEPKE